MTEAILVRVDPPEFHGFPKIPRFSRDIIITEKIDGTNAQIYIDEDYRVHVGSKNRWLQPTRNGDNMGFCAWVWDHVEDITALGPGRHFGEWWGLGIQRGYDQDRKRFSLFNVLRWADPLILDEFGLKPSSNWAVRPKCCDVVPILATSGSLALLPVTRALHELEEYGSYAAPGFMDPEGVVIYHTAGNVLFKKTIENDEVPKSREVQK